MNYVGGFTNKEGVSLGFCFNKGVCYFMVLPVSKICVDKRRAAELTVLYFGLKLA